MILGKNCYISERSSIRGKVEFGDNCSVFDFASIRADLGEIKIGNGTNIQDNCTLHVDPGFNISIGELVSVGHNAVLHGCKIGNNCLIGMGAIVMNGAEIGEGSVIGAGTLITQNTKIGANSTVVGVPGKVISVSSLNPETAKINAEEYIRLKNKYIEGLI